MLGYDIKHSLHSVPALSSSYHCIISSCVAGICPGAAACLYSREEPISLSQFMIITRDKFHKTPDCSAAWLLFCRQKPALFFYFQPQWHVVVGVRGGGVSFFYAIALHNNIVPLIMSVCFHISAAKKKRGQYLLSTWGRLTLFALESCLNWVAVCCFVLEVWGKWLRPALAHYHWKQWKHQFNESREGCTCNSLLTTSCCCRDSRSTCCVKVKIFFTI